MSGMNEELCPAREYRFDPFTGKSPDVEPTLRMLSEMEGMYVDEDAYGQIPHRDKVVVYEFYQLGIPERKSDIAFGTSIVYPGKVGREYFMTKGHFHEIENTGEAYYCLRGRGFMMMENRAGVWDARELSPGVSVYVPPGYAHRSINVSPDEPLVTFYSFRADAGHNYGTIETRGFRKLIVERNGRPEIIDNPRWG